MSKAAWKPLRTECPPEVPGRPLTSSVSCPHQNLRTVPFRNKTKLVRKAPLVKHGHPSVQASPRTMTLRRGVYEAHLSEGSDCHPQISYHKKLISTQSQAVRTETQRRKGRRLKLPPPAIPKRGNVKGKEKPKINFGPEFSTMKSPKNFGHIDITLRNFRQRRKRKDHESYAMMSRLSSLLVNVVFATSYVHVGTAEFLDHVPGYVRIGRRPNFAATALLLKQVLLCRCNGPITRLCRVINGPVAGN